MIADAQQREMALNPNESFIVQAPAGSGKTELLTQRTLVLLATVKLPEEILAITFTKKSALEMRNRILNALMKAKSEPEPHEHHAKKTWNLAKKALKNNELHGWRLLENPNRLRIQTIDSLNASLTHYLPVLSHFGAIPEISDHPEALYREAVRAFLAHLEENDQWSTALLQVMSHLDNHYSKVEQLLMDMIAKRDQWLPYIALNANDPTLQKKLEHHLHWIITDTLKILVKSFPKDESNELISLLKFASQHLLLNGSTSTILRCQHLENLPGDKLEDYALWASISDFLLTKERDWRKKIDKTIGFPSPSDAKGEDKHYLSEMKKRMLNLIEKCSNEKRLHEAFIELTKLPASHYDEQQWKTLEALHQVLQGVVAYLKLSFQQHGKVDYIENAEAALLALGEDTAPTDLAFILDYKIQHILVDEFQDTSNNQYRLLKKLTSEWTLSDGRTLFLVGDPMQSIYRFREAEVGLFIRARKYGIGNIKLIPLTLSVNFRSTESIISWVNHHFKTVFPPFEDIATGAVTFSESYAHQTDNEASFVKTHALMNANHEKEAKKIVEIIQEAKKINPSGTIAILVRSRTHLTYIIPALKAADLNYQAVNIDPLNTRPVIQDLMALTYALLQLNNRVAWLAVLRSPWVGMTLEDLYTLIGDDANTTVLAQLKNNERINQLSKNGQHQIKRFNAILFKKLKDRYRYSLRTWIESTWYLLGGPSVLNHPSELNDADTYFKLLETLDQGGDIKEIDQLNERVNYLYASPDHHADNALQIMTIHNAKGLEFDTVILPHLESKASSDDKQLLLWMERARENSDNALILAPLNAIGNDPDSIYEYIKYQHAIKTSHEYGRLLYVAVTRAKKRLHLLFNLQSKKESPSEPIKPNTHSLLNKLWPSLQNEIQFEEQKDVPPLIINEKKSFKLKRIGNNWITPVFELKEDDSRNYHQHYSGFLLPDYHLQKIGTLIHQITEQLVKHGIDWWNLTHEKEKKSYLKNQLTQLNVLPQFFEQGISTTLKAIEQFVSDPRGQWILESKKNSKSEWALTTLQNNEVISLIIDRTFIDDEGNRWIIDYKTSIPNNESLEIFLDREINLYKEKMTTYAEALYELDPRPTNLGLFFPLLPTWVEWPFLPLQQEKQKN